MSKLFGMRMSTVLLALVGFAVVCYAVLGCGASREGVVGVVGISDACTKQRAKTCGKWGADDAITFNETEFPGMDLRAGGTVGRLCLNKKLHLADGDPCGQLMASTAMGGICSGAPAPIVVWEGSPGQDSPPASCPNGCKIQSAAEGGSSDEIRLQCYKPPSS